MPGPPSTRGLEKADRSADRPSERPAQLVILSAAMTIERWCDEGEAELRMEQKPTRYRSRTAVVSSIRALPTGRVR